MISITYWKKDEPANTKITKVKAMNDFLIGRSVDCHLRFDSKYVSELHVRIVQPSETVSAVIEDMSSTNGVFINRAGRLIQLIGNRTRLLDGDILAIGDHLLIAKYEFNQPTSSAPMRAFETNSIINALMSLSGNNKETKLPTFGSLRKLIDILMPTDNDFEAFMIDHYHYIKKRFSAGMERKAKVNLLFENTDRGDIFRKLIKDYPFMIKNFRDLIEIDYEEP